MGMRLKLHRKTSYNYARHSRALCNLSKRIFYGPQNRTTTCVQYTHCAPLSTCSCCVRFCANADTSPSMRTASSGRRCAAGPRHHARFPTTGTMTNPRNWSHAAGAQNMCSFATFRAAHPIPSYNHFTVPLSDTRD